MILKIIIELIFISTIIYFLHKMLLNKFYAKRDKRKFVFGVTVLFAFLISIIVVLILNISFVPSSIKFNMQVWEENLSQRNKMAKYIIEKKLLIGKTKQEVINMLGNDYYNYPNMMSYQIGYSDNYMSVDPDVLYINFENNQVIEVKRGET